MANQVRVAGIGGSLAHTSSSLAALRVALEGARHAGAVTELLDIRQLNLPMYDPTEQPPPESVRRFCEVVANAQGLIWSSPLYHVLAVTKKRVNLDGSRRPLRGRRGEAYEARRAFCARSASRRR